MDDEPKKPPKPEEIQEQLKAFFKEKFGDQVFSMSFQPFGSPAAPAAAEEEEEDKREPWEDLEFNYTPMEIKEYLDRYVIGQDEAKKILSVAVCDHYNHVRDVLKNPEKGLEDYVKQNVILLGPTGVGKTYLIRILARLIGVPFVKADITKFSETGYVGGDVDDLVRELLRMADGDIELAECGIIFLDEIDKIATSAGPVGRDVSGRGVQTGLLKLLEETEVPSRSPFDMAAQLREAMQVSRGGRAGKGTINTKHLLFVVSGAFTSLPEIIEKRLSSSQVGFGAPAKEEDQEKDILKQVSTKDFIDYGFEPEFIGRLPVRVALDDLTEEDLFDILKHSEGSILKQYQENFEAYGMEVAFLDDGLKAVAEMAIKEKTGARGLMTVLESTLRDFKFYLPGKAVKRFAVSGALIQNPRAELDKLQANPSVSEKPFLEAQIHEFEEDFFKNHGIRIRLTPNAIKIAIAEADKRGERILEYLDTTLMDYVYGLRIIKKHTNQDEFTLKKENLEKPRDILDAWVKAALKKS
ncbi:MAG: AAA family ATPase [Planctomycetota bacterium]|jgi:endopeptidase Clp ATP-binding regulatory subunit ClpX